jgi:hypothetical protein
MKAQFSKQQTAIIFFPESKREREREKKWIGERENMSKRMNEYREKAIEYKRKEVNERERER